MTLNISNDGRSPDLQDSSIGGDRPAITTQLSSWLSSRYAGALILGSMLCSIFQACGTDLTMSAAPLAPHLDPTVAITIPPVHNIATDQVIANVDLRNAESGVLYATVYGINGNQVLNPIDIAEGVSNVTLPATIAGHLALDVVSDDGLASARTFSLLVEHPYTAVPASATLGSGMQPWSPADSINVTNESSVLRLWALPNLSPAQLDENLSGSVLWTQDSQYGYTLNPLLDVPGWDGQRWGTLGEIQPFMGGFRASLSGTGSPVSLDNGANPAFVVEYWNN